MRQTENWGLLSESWTEVLFIFGDFPSQHSNTQYIKHEKSKLLKNILGSLFLAAGGGGYGKAVALELPQFFKYLGTIKSLYINFC